MCPLLSMWFLIPKSSTNCHFYEAFWCLFVPLCLSRFPPHPSSPTSCSPSDTAAVGAATLTPRQALLSRVCFLHQPLLNEAGVTDHWLDNEFILQTHREPGTSLAHLFSRQGSGSAVCKERGEHPAELLMCNRARGWWPLQHTLQSQNMGRDTALGLLQSHCWKCFNCEKKKSGVKKAPEGWSKSCSTHITQAQCCPSATSISSRFSKRNKSSRKATGL